MNSVHRTTNTIIRRQAPLGDRTRARAPVAVPIHAREADARRARCGKEPAHVQPGQLVRRVVVDGGNGTKAGAALRTLLRWERRRAFTGSTSRSGRRATSRSRTREFRTNPVTVVAVAAVSSVRTCSGRGESLDPRAPRDVSSQRRRRYQRPDHPCSASSTGTPSSRCHITSTVRRCGGDHSC